MPFRTVVESIEDDCRSSRRAGQRDKLFGPVTKIK
jgi:hypothetical protein